MKSQLILLAAVIALASCSPQNAVAVEEAEETAIGVAERAGADESHSDVQNDYYYRYGVGYVGNRLYMAPATKGVYYPSTYTAYNSMAQQLIQCQKERDELLSAASPDLQEEAQPGADAEEDKEEKPEEEEEEEVEVAPGTCGMKPDSGPCRSYVQRYYFNDETQQCERFTYGGCGGNSNNYATQFACENSCNEGCKKPVNVGFCFNRIPRYYFSTITNRCELFIYGGCGGNSNNFLTMQQCQSTCDGACTLPQERGPCRSTIGRWYHNAATGQCEVFIYGGCGGNANNFITKEACDAHC